MRWSILGLPDATHIVILISEKVSINSFFWIATNFRGHKEEAEELAKRGEISAEKWHCWRENCHICICRRECCHISTFSALHILWDWTKYNHNQPSWLREPSITFKILAYCDTGVYNTCFKISSDLASSKKNHHLGFQQSGPIGVLPCYLKSLTARITESRRKDLSSLKIPRQSEEINRLKQNFKSVKRRKQVFTWGLPNFKVIFVMKTSSGTIHCLPSEPFSAWRLLGLFL